MTNPLSHTSALPSHLNPRSLNLQQSLPSTNSINLYQSQPQQPLLQKPEDDLIVHPSLPPQIKAESTSVQDDLQIPLQLQGRVILTQDNPANSIGNIFIGHGSRAQKDPPPTHQLRVQQNPSYLYFPEAQALFSDPEQKKKSIPYNRELLRSRLFWNSVSRNFPKDGLTCSD